MHAGSDVAKSGGVALLLTSVLALPLSGACFCSPPNGPPPEPAECETASAVEITRVELGDTTSPFTPSAHAERIRGGQGLPMLAFRIAVQADGEPTCIAQRTEAGSTTFDRPLQIVAHEGDWWVTSALYVITDASSISVTTTVGDLEIARTMSPSSSSDAGSDASEVDAGE